ALRRRWRLVLALALSGLALGGMFFTARPPQWTATTSVLVRRPTTTAADPTRQMETDIQMAQSSTVLSLASSHLGPGIFSDYAVSSQSNDVLQITTHAPTASGAVQSADALATAFLSFRSQQLVQEAQALSAVLKAQSDPLTAKVAALNAQITAASDQAAASNAQSGLGELLASRAQLNGELASIEQRSNDATTSATVAAQNSRVLDPASPRRPSKLRLLGADLAAGLLGGAFLASGWVLFVAATTERVRRRDDVMAALAAPVAVSVNSAPRHLGVGSGPGSIDLGRLRRGHDEPGPDVIRMAHHLRRAVAASDTARPGLLVVSVASESAAAFATATAGAVLRRDGNAILMADCSKGSALGRLLGATERLTTVHSGPPASKLWLASDRLDLPASVEQWLPVRDLGEQADIILVLATLDPAVGAGHLAELASTAVVVATAGRSTATALRSVGRMIRAEGIHLHSAMLVGADRNDETCGALVATHGLNDMADDGPGR
ncbi:MAG: Wzz/FepE/Etk N-terminal domain-containing protein, partial [Actinomycetota bacterium]|nr:Wzz/FepE/Etk N-terminal domain-containing protein [Actinomycetota bacterium]